MARRDIREGQVVLFNPCPRVTQTELDEMIDHVDYKSKPEKQVFEIEVDYGNTGTSQDGISSRVIIALQPGDHDRVLASAGDEIKDAYQDHGLVIVKDESELDEAIPKALSRLKNHLNERGSIQITKYKQRHGLQDHEMEAEKPQIIGYFRNAKKAELIDKQLKSFLADLREKKKTNNRSK